MDTNNILFFTCDVSKPDWHATRTVYGNELVSSLPSCSDTYVRCAGVKFLRK